MIAQSQKWQNHVGLSDFFIGLSDGDVQLFAGDRPVQPQGAQDPRKSPDRQKRPKERGQGGKDHMAPPG